MLNAVTRRCRAKTHTPWVQFPESLRCLMCNTLPLMTPSALTVRCMAWQEQGLWVAACIDLALAIQADTFEAARTGLHEQISVYVTEAFTIDGDHAEQLLARKARLWDQLRYDFWQMVSNRPRLRHAVGRAINAAGVAIRRKLAYSEPLPLRIA